MAASGATACTISVSSTSSAAASQGDACARMFDHLQPRGRQAEQAVKSGQVLPDVGDRWRAGVPAAAAAGREFQQHNGLAAASDPAISSGWMP